MSGFWYLVIGLAVGASLVYAYYRFFGCVVIEPPKPPHVDPDLLAAVTQLHKVLFAGFGAVVTPMFNNVWKAAKLEPKGVPDITGGRT
jgi:hypothetical protein